MRRSLRWTASLILTITLLTDSKTLQDERTDRTDPQRKEQEILENGMELDEEEIDEAAAFGIESLEQLMNIKEPMLYRMGLFLGENEAGAKVAAFGAPSEKARKLSQFGFAALEASRRIAESHPEDVGRQTAGFGDGFRSRLLLEECPLRGRPRCTSASKRYRTFDGTCNNLKHPWRGSSMLPMQRFLPPTYEDGIQSIRRSVFGTRLPSPREISVRIHRDKNREIQTVTLMFMQWGQFVDHDLTSAVKSRAFNGSIPRCCARGGTQHLPPDLLHPSCLPIDVASDDWFLSRFGIRCLEFTRSAPSTRIDCDLGWREQINQATPFLDASAIYGNEVDLSDSIRTFRNGKIFYGRPRGQDPLNPPDPPNGELCREGAVSSECFQSGDGRVDEQPGLTAMHTVWIRFHNQAATILSLQNPHWSDEKIFQETRKIVYSLIQHITYREFLPLVLGQEVMELFELDLLRKGFYQGYDSRIQPAIANSFSTAAFRFGHSLVQNSYVRFDRNHRPLTNNVSLHQELDNSENIWTTGALDRLLLGFSNQPSQRRDEFLCNELTNHLFQSDLPFGLDLAAINIQRGRDHGIPPYTSWREPCGLSKIKSWKDLEDLMSVETARRLQSLYEHPDDIDLFTGGLAEKPVRGGIVGPTFACIIAQQFLNLRKGDRFWYENGNMENSFTPAQLQQIRKTNLAHILCQTSTEMETIQPFVFLSADSFKNIRISCRNPSMKFDYTPWKENSENEVDSKLDFEGREGRKKCKRNKRRKGTTKPKSKIVKIPIVNVTTSSVRLENKNGAFNAGPKRPSFNNYQQQQLYNDYGQTDVTYLFGVVPKTTPLPKKEQPIEFNIKIQYYPPTTTQKTKTKTKTRTTKRPITRNPTTQYDYPIFIQNQPEIITVNRPGYYDADEISNQPYRPLNGYVTTKRPYIIRPTDSYDLGHGSVFDNSPFSTSRRPIIHHYYPDAYTTPRPFQDHYQNQNRPYNRDDPDKDEYLQLVTQSNRLTQRPTFGQTEPKPVYTIAHVQKLDNKVNDKLDFKTKLITLENSRYQENNFVRISSVKKEASLPSFHLESKEGELNLNQDPEKIKVVDLNVYPSEISDWVMFNATEELMPLLPVPDVNGNVACSKELPKPMNTSESFNIKRRFNSRKAKLRRHD